MRKLTQEEFIQRCVDVWGNQYDLSKVVYRSSREAVIVACRLHGDFTVSANNFVGNKSGCPACGGQFAKPTSQFIAEAKAVHGERYDYSKSNYTRHNHRLVIVCPKHGKFLQEPYVHLRGSGCPSCGKVKRITTESFIARSKEIYGDRYTYERTVYTTATNKVTITCKEHGDFLQFAHNHFLGKGCVKCGYKSISKTKTMPAEAAAKICNERGINLLKYAGDARRKSLLQCSLGHEWEAPISRITRGSSCPACAISGYNPAKRGSLYALLSVDGKHMKIGLSNHPKQRIKLLAKATPFPFTVFSHKEMSGPVAARLERHIHKMCKSAELSGFDGCTEWFHVDKEILELFMP